MLEQFLEQNSSLSDLNLEDKLSKHDEASIIQIPNTIDPEFLIGKCIGLDMGTKLKLGKKKFLVTVTDDQPSDLIILTKKIQNKASMSSLQLINSIKSVHCTEIPPMDKAVINLPQNLRVRHPIFGDKYEEEITLKDLIIHKLKHVKNAGSSKTKKKREQKDKAKKQQDNPEDDELIFSLLRDTTFRGKPTRHTKKASGTLLNSTEVSDSQLPGFNLDLSEIVRNSQEVAVNKNVKMQHKKSKLKYGKLHDYSSTELLENSGKKRKSEEPIVIKGSVKREKGSVSPQINTSLKKVKVENEKTSKFNGKAIKPMGPVTVKIERY